MPLFAVVVVHLVVLHHRQLGVDPVGRSAHERNCHLRVHITAGEERSLTSFDGFLFGLRRRVMEERWPMGQLVD